ncbi:nucleotidyltransferase domain-containing protein [Paenibacillus alvei]|uniref:nucleotidyltransferase domain-containing protein n=1 Tax=Paenibacillus alvei TaxID=44250 RepID=UPI00227FDF50|nr:nucleotidyltransferase domain-containing protein [Paenibacillus alvei]MCY9737514.1 nucleotidyltransferase domain-containing protein [Paenibacillus alvei]
MDDFWNKRLIYKAYSGSISYGTNTPESDVDTRGICIPPTSYLIGLDRFDQYNNNTIDETIYSLSKFIRLAMDCNPNIIELLYVKEEHIIFTNVYGRSLRDIRDQFLSKRAYKTFGGYAYAQLKKMTTIEKNAVGKRAETISKYGYDTKNAMRCIMLMRMGFEILSGDGVNVYREDRDFLKSIRYGELTLNDIKDEYNRLNELLNKAYETTKLPDHPNYHFFNGFVTGIHEKSLDWSGNYY